MRDCSTTSQSLAKAKGKSSKDDARRGTERPARKKSRKSATPKPEPLLESPDLGLDEPDDIGKEAPELGIGSRMIPPHVSFVDPFDSLPPHTPARGDVAEQIKSLEARLDGLIRTSVTRSESDSDPQAALAPQAEPSERSATPDGEPPDSRASAYFEKQWGRDSLRSRSEEVDDFGLDPAYENRVRPVAEFLYKSYFRTKTTGIENLPARGRCILVANHSGTLPLDGLMLRTAVRMESGGARELRWLAEDVLFYLPFAGVFMNRVGAVRACQENAERLLAKDHLVAVFPEGIHGIKKLYSERYRLQRFGRGGFIRLALRMRATIVPCAIVGAEETNPLLYRLEYLAGLMGLPYIPVTPTFPLLGPLGLLPAPSRWRISFGEPVSLDHHGPEVADDHVLVGRLSDRVRGTIQAMLDSGVRERRSVWFG
jgi:1-acyl-sn-glycerol-3-phosphate acyltransferase